MWPFRKKSEATHIKKYMITTEGQLLEYEYARRYGWRGTGPMVLSEVVTLLVNNAGLKVELGKPAEPARVVKRPQASYPDTSA
jgi:hypothetical protein